MGTKCKTGKQRQALMDSLKEMRVKGFSWINRDGYRLKIVEPYIPSEGEHVDVLIRLGNKVKQVTITGKDAGCRVRDGYSRMRGNPSLVLATIQERHPIPGVSQNGHWGNREQDRYPGFPRPRNP